MSEEEIHKNCNEVIRRLQAENEKLRWHDVKKELPKSIEQYCHIYVPEANTKTTFHGWYNVKHKYWLTTLPAWHKTKKVTHWQTVTFPEALKETKQ